MRKKLVIFFLLFRHPSLLCTLFGKLWHCVFVLACHYFVESISFKKRSIAFGGFTSVRGRGKHLAHDFSHQWFQTDAHHTTICRSQHNHVSNQTYIWWRSMNFTTSNEQWIIIPFFSCFCAPKILYEQFYQRNKLKFKKALKTNMFYIRNISIHLISIWMNLEIDLKLILYE